MTQEEAGVRFGAAKGTPAKVRWYQIEANIQNPNLATIESVCRVLGVGVDEILTDDSPSMPTQKGRAEAR